ncbi:hypothetical protein AA984_17645 [Brevibacillus formosus]|uniref:Uncharacterized protein n=1 Tax=Brevibacillus formosus TaxID=54913 RepID=A0A837KIY1_9BACL|nr:hypothetical protein AA984_17645 [Brevibacillus formosus]PSJ98893.1 hypothetical protein C7R91_05755 [Brevibacillus formosus]GED57617.1 hypothetical protein BFO01nite_17490 [Brevibacillus formosus]
MTDGQTFNRFAYVNGDPIGFIDPLGLMKCSKLPNISQRHDEIAHGGYYGRKQQRINDYKNKTGKWAPRKSDDDVIEVNPKDVNFAQISINRSFDTPNGKIPIKKAIQQGPEQVKNFPPISVVNVKGQLVARDGNSRLYVALETKAEKIKVRIEKDIDSFRDLTKRLRNNGLPNEGTMKPPTPR